MVYPIKTRWSALSASVLCLLLLPDMAQAQGRASLKEVDQRLQRVERVLDQSLLELLQQVDSLKRDIRRLRGELESQANLIQSMQKTNRDLYLDTDQRISDLEDSGGSGLVDPLLVDDVGLQDPGEGDASDGQAQDSESTTTAIRTEPTTSEEKNAYADAYDLLASGKNPEAIASFKTFLQKYPDGRYSANAWYWQGEALYAQREFDDAIINFLQVIDFFPNSRKVPDARLKVGFAQYEKGLFKEARATLMAVREDYPGRSASVLAGKRLDSMDAKGQ